MSKVNTIRALCFRAGVLRSQQKDPLCGNCKAWANSVAAVREKLARSCSGHETRPDMIPTGIGLLFSEAQTLLDGIVVPPDLSGQKKAGNCLLPPGICFVKSSLAILEKL